MAVVKAILYVGVAAYVLWWVGLLVYSLERDYERGNRWP